MKVGERIRTMIRNFLQIEPAPAQTFRLSESTDWQGTCAINRVWYRGDAAELNELFSQMPRTTQRFWGAVPTSGLEIRKAHTGLPREIVETLSGLLVGDMNDVDLAEPAQTDLWAKIAKENDFTQLVTAALCGTMVIGDGAFKLNLDADVSKLPILEWVDGDRVEFERKRGRITEVIFTSYYPDRYTLREHYGRGYVHYQLLRDDNECDTDTLEAVTGLQDTVFDSSVMLAVPLMFRASNRHEGRGQSFFEGKTDPFDMLDEAYSQWWDAMRKSRPVRYIPTSLLRYDEKTLQPVAPNPFDTAFVEIGDDTHENGKNDIRTVQAEFFADQYNSTSITALDLCLQGLISPSTLGIDTKKLDNAEAQREKEKTTLYTRSLMLAKLTDALTELVTVTMQAVDLMNGLTPKEYSPSITFGEYANPSFEAVVETLSNPNTPMSTEAKVEELWGSTKDDAWKAEEVERIKAERGIVSMDEPSFAEGLNG